MKILVILASSKKLAHHLLVLFLLLGSTIAFSSNNFVKDTIGYKQFKGTIIDSKTKKELVFATLTVNETNISTVTNTQGQFLIKVPAEYLKNKITISFLGYTSIVLDISSFNAENNTIKLETYIEELSEVKITVKDARSLVEETLKRRDDNYFTNHLEMTAFYRETIKKRRSYISLSEAVVEVYKQPYSSMRNDILKLYKARKSTDYEKLDTITFKLQGGPFSTLRLDVMKNPELLFTYDLAENYDFKLENPTKIDNRQIYVVSFKQKPHVKDPLFYGNLFIDSSSLALISADFSLNLSDVEEAARLFIIKKPNRANVEPIEAQYHVDFRQKDGKWFYGYSRIQLGFKIDYDRKLFNSVYHLTMEMAITDWVLNEENTSIRYKERLKSSIILNDEASGFSDPEFWGEFNVIEPEKPIETAIKKIQKQLEKSK